MGKMRMMIVGTALVSMVGLISWRDISRDPAVAPPVVQHEQAAAIPVVQHGQAQATLVVQDKQGQTTPGAEFFQLNAPTAEGECFSVDPPCGQANCRGLGGNYTCQNIDTCCCPFKACT